MSLQNRNNDSKTQTPTDKKATRNKKIVTKKNNDDDDDYNLTDYELFARFLSLTDKNVSEQQTLTDKKPTKNNKNDDSLAGGGSNIKTKKIKDNKIVDGKESDTKKNAITTNYNNHTDDDDNNNNNNTTNREKNNKIIVGLAVKPADKPNSKGYLMNDFNAFTVYNSLPYSNIDNVNDFLSSLYKFIQTKRDENDKITSYDNNDETNKKDITYIVIDPANYKKKDE